ncbi:MAG: glycosyltransferase family 2 protein [Thermoplasmata archaeon]|nr:glycosyltransferase family 2 protein [Thermoplasmata archaeon]
MLGWSHWPWGLAALLTVIGGVLGWGVIRLHRSLDRGHRLPPLSEATYSVFSGVRAEAPSGFRGFAWKFTTTFVLLGSALLLVGPWLFAGFGSLEQWLAAIALWPRPAALDIQPDYVFLLFVALFATLATVVGLEFDAVRCTPNERTRPVAYLGLYILAAAAIDVALGFAQWPFAYGLIPRSLLGGEFYTLALFRLASRPRPIVIVTERRDPATKFTFALCLGVSILAAVAVIVLLYPVWLATGNAVVRVSFLLLIPSLSVVFFGAFGLLLYLRSEGREARLRPSVADFHPAVSIIIPAYNEAPTIAETLARVDAAAAEYPGSVEVIVGNDGSSDRTSEVARVAMQVFRHSTGRCLDLAHGGKSSALNGALLAAKGEVVLRIDADTPVVRFASIIPYFHDRDMGEVQGRILPVRRTGWIARFRLMEVMWNHAFFRRALLITGAVQVLSGNFCAFRRDRLLAAGGWVPWNGEDAEISIRFLRLGYKLRMDLDSLAYEDTPDTVGHWLKQRIRWNRGGFFSHAYHYGALFGGLECGAASIYWWLWLAARSARKYLVLVFALALSLAVLPFDIFRVLVLMGLMFLPRAIVIAAFLARWGFLRQVGWALAWPVLWVFRSYFYLESLGTILPGNAPEFSD